MNTGAAFAPAPAPSDKPKRKKPAKSPSQLSMDLLRAGGHTCQKVEQWKMFGSKAGGGVRVDLFNCIDILAIMDCKIVGIQCGSNNGGNHSGHKKKCIAEPRCLEFIQTGARMFLHSWWQPKGKGTSWILREEELTIADFATAGELNLL